MPLAVLLLSSSVWFWSYANSAMLDAGAAVFAAGALAAAIVALHRPRVWYVVAAVVGVGALQKAPVGLMFLASALPALWLARRAVGPEWAPPAQSPSFLRAAVIAIALVLAWPLLQSALHGIKAAKASHGREMVARFVPDAQEGLRSFAEVAELLVTGEPWLRWPALAAVLVLPFLVRRPGAWMVAGVVVVYAAALKMAGGTVYPRYTLTILPLLMAALAVVLLHLRPSPLAGMIAGGALIVMSGGPLQVSAVRGEALQPATISLQIGVLKDLSPEVAPEETLVYCLSRGVRRLLPGAVSVYASNGREFVAARDLRAKSGAVEGPFRGVCPATEIGQVEPIMRGFAVVRSEFGYVVWTADGLR
jgi:hypothetical protein